MQYCLSIACKAKILTCCLPEPARNVNSCVPRCFCVFAFADQKQNPLCTPPSANLVYSFLSFGRVFLYEKGSRRCCRQNAPRHHRYLSSKDAGRHKGRGSPRSVGLSWVVPTARPRKNDGLRHVVYRARKLFLDQVFVEIALLIRVVFSPENIRST